MGRPRVLSDEALVEAGRRLTLPRVTVRAIADEIGVSEMSVYRRVGNVDALRRLVADGIVRDADFAPADHPDPEDALVDLSMRLRDYVRDNPGIGDHLANLDGAAPGSIARIDAAQRQFAERHALSPAHASILVSTVAEHAVALASLDPRSHRERRDGTGLDDAPTVRSGAAASAGLTPDQRFEWSIRATARGAMALLGMTTRSDSPFGLGA
jgi:AcrR family transcriptional regulator